MLKGNSVHHFFSSFSVTVSQPEVFCAEERVLYRSYCRCSKVGVSYGQDLPGDVRSLYEYVHQVPCWAFVSRCSVNQRCHIA